MQTHYHLWSFATSWRGVETSDENIIPGIFILTSNKFSDIQHEALNTQRMHNRTQHLRSSARIL